MVCRLGYTMKAFLKQVFTFAWIAEKPVPLCHRRPDTETMLGRLSLQRTSTSWLRAGYRPWNWENFALWRCRMRNLANAQRVDVSQRKLHLNAVKYSQVMAPDVRQSPSRISAGIVRHYWFIYKQPSSYQYRSCSETNVCGQGKEARYIAQLVVQ